MLWNVTEDNESNWKGLERNGLQRENTLLNMMGVNESDWTERIWMNCNIKVLLWSMTWDDESDCDGLERNVLQLENTLWNVIGVYKSYWVGKELNVLKCAGFNMEHDGRWWIQSGKIRTECIETWKYTMKYDGRKCIRLGQKET